MRPLTDPETEKVLSKLAKYLGRNVKQLVERRDQCFRRHR